MAKRPPTIKAAKAFLRPFGITLNSVPSTGEYRVNFLGGKEATACYATDLIDAIGTGKAMAKARVTEANKREARCLCLLCGNALDNPCDQCRTAEETPC